MPRTYQQVHQELMDADRARGRIAYANGTSDRAIRKAQRTPEYREAEERYRALSAEIKQFPRQERRANRALARRMGF